VIAPSLATLVLLTGVGPFATDAYLPGLPALQHSLHTSAAIAQLTLTAFIIGVAIGQLVFGPISDGAGRRPVLLAGAIGFLVTSALCALVSNGPLMVVLRLLEGFAAGAMVGPGRAMVSDTSRGLEAARRYGTLASVTLLAPVLAPPLGSAILGVGSWRLIFTALALGGAAMVAAVLVLPETLPAERRQGGTLGANLARVKDLSSDWNYMRHVAVQCLATMGFFSYIGGSAFTLETVYGIDQSRYAEVFTVNALAMVTTSVVFRALVGRVGAPVLRAWGLGLAVTGATGLLVVALLGPDRVGTLAAPWALLSFVTGGMGLAIPGAQVLAQEAGRRSGGTAAALFGGLLFLAGSLVTPLTGVLGYATLLPMALLMFGFLSAAALLAIAAAVLGQPSRASSSTPAGSTGERGEARSWRANSRAASGLAPGPDSR
jgi:DHA1 family bicyclomycin/chloramphenicol resistance-like MFS transporter